MYNSPQTFFDDESPPTSPHLPTSHLSPAPPGQKAERSEHRKWNSLARPEPHTLPYSYEYVFEDGKLAGLVEHHPDQFWHYSSSRGSSQTNSRNPSRRTSAQDSTRSSTDTSYSNNSDYSHTPNSPRTTDRIKRVLSLSRIRGQRSSLDDQRKRPSVDSKPQGIGLELPETPTTPTKRDIPILPFEPFESPRAAPQPPTKSISKSSKPASEPITAHKVELKRKDSMGDEIKNNGLGTTRISRPSTPAEGKERSFEGPKRPVNIDPALEQASTEFLQTEQVVVRPPLRRKTSKFIEHLDEKSTKVAVDADAEENGAPVTPSPFIPPFDFMLPTSTTQPELPQAPQQQRRSRQPLRRSQTVARREPTYTHPEWPSIFNVSSSPTKPITTPPAKTVPKFALGPRTQLLPNHIVRKRSASKMKTAESLQPTSTSLKRATSMRTRPPTIWADVCEAEVKTTLMSPVVASGHARMVSC